MNDGSRDCERFLSPEIKTHKIMTVEPAKRSRIIDAALSGFLFGYGKANTDTITETAGISKGLLFHYFGTKKDLYFFLFRYCVEIIGGEYRNLEFRGNDFIENLLQLSAYAQVLIARYPLVYSFLGNSVLTIRTEFPGELEIYENPLDTIKAELMARADRSVFRDGIDADRALRIILWTIEGFSNELTKEVENLGTLGPLEQYDSYFEEVGRRLEAYLDTVRNAFYR